MEIWLHVLPSAAIRDMSQPARHKIGHKIISKILWTILGRFCWFHHWIIIWLISRHCSRPWRHRNGGKKSFSFWLERMTISKQSSKRTSYRFRLVVAFWSMMDHMHNVGTMKHRTSWHCSYFGLLTQIVNLCNNVFLRECPEYQATHDCHFKR